VHKNRLTAVELKIIVDFKYRTQETAKWYNSQFNKDASTTHTHLYAGVAAVKACFPDDADALTFQYQAVPAGFKWDLDSFQANKSTRGSQSQIYGDQTISFEVKVEKIKENCRRDRERVIVAVALAHSWVMNSDFDASELLMKQIVKICEEMVREQLQRKLGLTRHLASIRDLESNSPSLKTLAHTKDPVDGLCLRPSRHLQRTFESVTGGIDVGRYDL